MNKTVFLVWDSPRYESIILVGIYSTKEKAIDAAKEYMKKEDYTIRKEGHIDNNVWYEVQWTTISVEEHAVL